MRKYRLLIRDRAEEQLKESQGGTIINPEKRLRKGKDYVNQDFQSVLEYTRINKGQKKKKKK